MPPKKAKKKRAPSPTPEENGSKTAPRKKQKVEADAKDMDSQKAEKNSKSTKTVPATLLSPSPAVATSDQDSMELDSNQNQIPWSERHAESGLTNAFDQMLQPFYCGKKLNDPIKLARDKWNLIPAFLQAKGVISQHIDSFNYFVETQIKQIVLANQTIRSELDERFFFQYTDVYLGRPCRIGEHHMLGVSNVTPNECRNRDMTYAAPIYVDVRYLEDNRIVTARKQYLGRLPIMLKSSPCVLHGKTEKQMAAFQECPVDPGGYFIVKGQEKVILIQEQLSKNRIIVESHKGFPQASVTSSTYDKKSKNYVISHKGKLLLRHSALSEDIPIVIMMKALGIDSDKEISWLITASEDRFERVFAPNFEEAQRAAVSNTPEALEFLGARIRSRKSHGRNYQSEALDALLNVILTHIPVEDKDLKPKAVFLALMVRRLLMALENPEMIDDRDYLGNKRLELSGQMMSLLFEDSFKRFNQNFQRTLDNHSKRQYRLRFNALSDFQVHHGYITQGFERALASGTWHLQRFKMERAGITTPLSRLSYISALGTLTRISSQFEKSRKVSGPRALQPSQFGMLCPSDTPEGESCGLAKNLALMTHVTTEMDDKPILQIIEDTGCGNFNSNNGSDGNSVKQYIVFINGTPVALSKNPTRLAKAIIDHRRTGEAARHVNVHVNDTYQAVHIATDDGRVCRPLIIVENQQPKITEQVLQELKDGHIGYAEFLSRGLVEYIDVNEENECLIAANEKDIGSNTTHLEIDPFTILGVVAGVIPYPHHNQSPRNTYQCAMGKQAIGAIAYNQFGRIDPLLYTMVYPQKPLVKTKAMDMIQYDRLPAGQNAVVAVMSYSSFDIEDAIVINKASCDRGFGRCQVFRKYIMQFKANKYGAKEEYGQVDRNSDHLNAHGFVEPASHVKKGSILASKSIPPSTPAINEHSHASMEWSSINMSYKHDYPAIIDKVMVSESEGGSKQIKVQTRQTRVPEVGDKFSSRHGQKGCVGLVAEQEDLPFDDDGVVPDIIMNPHGFPSRMTVGKVLELISGKIAANEGGPQDGSAFNVQDEDLSQALVAHGFTYSGKTNLTSGITGESIPATVFSGPIYYQKLKHMVEDKIHGRASGPKAMMTRQPTEGRQKGGGLRLGEMERDCLIAYGASQLLIERLMLSSDKYDCEVCEKCGTIGFRGWCQSCQGSKDVVHVQIPYAAKLLVQEMAGMNIMTKLQVRKPSEKPIKKA